MTIQEQTKQLCKKYNINPQRSKGQNFLIAEEVYNKIIEAADLRCQDAVLEVGPGLGFLTERLAARAGRVVSVELDDKLAEAARQRMREQGIGNVEVVNDNILDFLDEGKELGFKNQESRIDHQKPENSNKYKTLRSYPPTTLRSYPLPPKIVANLPYNITSIFLRKILQSYNPTPLQPYAPTTLRPYNPTSLTLLLQKEVAERITAAPPKMSLLGVSVQFYADAEIIQTVGKEDFWPVPKVDSAIIKISPKGDIPPVDEQEFWPMLKFGFSAKRKMLKNNLAGGWQIPTDKAEKMLILAGLNPKARAQDLSVKNWLKLLAARKEKML